jgi:hypothetical protein
MYQAYFQWSATRSSFVPEDEGQPEETRKAEDREAIIESVREEALTFFGKREEHEALVRANEQRLRLKTMWNGRKVGEWIGGNGRVIGKVMNLLRQTIGEEKIGQMTEEELKQHVLHAKETVDMEDQQAREKGQDEAEST